MTFLLCCAFRYGDMEVRHRWMIHSYLHCIYITEYLAFIDISICRSLMLNEHPVCQYSLIKLSALYNSQMLKFRLLDWHCAQLIRLMPVKSCQLAHLSSQVSLYIYVQLLHFFNMIYSIKWCIYVLFTCIRNRYLLSQGRIGSNVK